MPNLTRQSVEKCIMAAYAMYLNGTQGNTVCHTIDDGDVTIQCVINGTRFNCGFNGYQMDQNEVENLRNWCITHPGGPDHWSFGFRYPDHNHPNSVNVTLIDKTVLMFNFHVSLY